MQGNPNILPNSQCIGSSLVSLQPVPVTSQKTLLISEYYLPSTTAFFCLHVFWRAENNKREPSVHRVGPSTSKSHLRTSEFSKIVSHLWKLANCNEPYFFLTLSFQNLLPIQVLQCLQDDSLPKICMIRIWWICSDYWCRCTDGNKVVFFKINASKGQI